MSLLLIAGLLGLIYICLKCICNCWNDRKVPPGPKGVPLLGYVPFLKSSRLYEEAAKLSAQYGDVVSMRLGDKLLVFLNSMQAIRQAFVTQGDAFSKKPNFVDRDLLNPDRLGLGMNDGPRWLEIRRFTLKILKDFGLGKNIMEDIISQEVNLVRDVFLQHVGKPFNPKKILGKAVSNVISLLVFQHRPGFEDPEFETYLKAMEKILQAEMNPIEEIILQYLLIFRPIANLVRKFHWRSRNWNLMRKYTDRKILEHAEEFKDESEARDYIDAFLKEKHRLDLSAVQSHTFCLPQLSLTVRELFTAGTDTTSTSLSWALLMMAIHKDTVQARVIKEIQEVVGTRAVNIADRKNLPYTEATINEVLRFRTTAPLGLPHSVEKDTLLLDHTIPSGTIVLANIFAVHRDQKLWRYPYRFEPENFLNFDANGLLVVEGSEKLLSFSVGKRACLGESLARMELFLFFTGLVQQFEFSLSKYQTIDLQNLLNGSTGNGIICAPNDFFLDISHR